MGEGERDHNDRIRGWREGGWVDEWLGDKWDVTLSFVLIFSLGYTTPGNTTSDRNSRISKMVC